jgi:hypothetical protein
VLAVAEELAQLPLLRDAAEDVDELRGAIIEMEHERHQAGGRAASAAPAAGAGGREGE